MHITQNKDLGERRKSVDHKQLARKSAREFLIHEILEASSAKFIDANKADQVDGTHVSTHQL